MKAKLDAIFCHWPLLGIPIIVIDNLSNHNLQDNLILQIVVSILFGGGWLIALIYAFFRLSKQQWPTNKIILWVLGLLWFSVFSLPYLYWKYLRKE